MKKIKLESTHQITHLFELLSISESSLRKMHYSLLSLCLRKEKAVQKRNYDEAANLRQKERIIICKIIKSLNSKGILDKNVLKVNFTYKE